MFKSVILCEINELSKLIFVTINIKTVPTYFRYVRKLMIQKNYYKIESKKNVVNGLLCQVCGHCVNVQKVVQLYKNTNHISGNFDLMKLGV